MAHFVSLAASVLSKGGKTYGQEGKAVNFLPSLQKNVTSLQSFLFLMIFFKHFWQDKHEVEIK
jgi:hypothetical protein